MTGVEQFNQWFPDGTYFDLSPAPTRAEVALAVYTANGIPLPTVGELEGKWEADRTTIEASRERFSMLMEPDGRCVLDLMRLAETDTRGTDLSKTLAQLAARVRSEVHGARGRD